MESDGRCGEGAGLARWWGHPPQPSPSTDVMNQLCRVCGEPAAGFHFGAFTCEGCKSFFGRTYNNLGSITECKNNGECVINKKNRTACKACRLRKCLLVGMSKSGSRYGRRSNWFKIHCLLQEQQVAGGGKEKTGSLGLWGESYKAMVEAESFRNAGSDSETKSSPTEDNNNTSLKDRERSPPHPTLPPTSYSAEAAAAIWAARNSFLPMQIPPTSIGMPFLPSPFPGMHGPQTPRFLLPFMHGLHPPQLSPSPSRSSRSSCSHSPSPGHQPPSSPHQLLPEPTERLIPPQRLSSTQPHPKISEEQSVAILRGLGPVQDRPMDLSVKETFARHRRKNSSTRRIECGSVHSSPSSASDRENSGDENQEQNDENFNKRKTPLDLTKSIRVIS